MDSVAKRFLEKSAWQIREGSFPKIREAMERLDDHQVWERPVAASNSIGNLLLHLEGNVRQHVISGLGGARDIRDRPSEFAATGGRTRSELLDRLGVTVGEASRVIESFDPGRLLEKGLIQGKEVVYMEDLYHVVEHFSYHAGQIILLVKIRTGRGFPWYQHLEPKK